MRTQEVEVLTLVLLSWECLKSHLFLLVPSLYQALPRQVRLYFKLLSTIISIQAKIC